MGQRERREWLATILSCEAGGEEEILLPTTPARCLHHLPLLVVTGRRAGQEGTCRGRALRRASLPHHTATPTTLHTCHGNAELGGPEEGEVEGPPLCCHLPHCHLQ